MTSQPSADVVIVGGGIFGITTALALNERGARVTLVDPGPIPHPDAASTDISKLVRADYGKDVFYTELMEAAFPSWREMNARFGVTLFHETGFLVLSREEMKSGSFERESFDLLTARGRNVKRLDAREISACFPAWREGAYVDGYVNAMGGWAESGRVVTMLAERARRAGVVIREHARVLPIAEGDGRVDHVETESGERIFGETIVIAAGAFTPLLLPELADRLSIIGQPVLHFAVDDGARFSPPAFLPWAADIARTGWYGFAHHAGVVKVANHGRGVAIDPRAARAVPKESEEKFRAFFRDAIPALANAPRVFERLCLYCDSFDGDFLIDRHPTRAGLVVASGGSGHAFKFAPVLGTFVADRVENKGDRALQARFKWRELTAATLPKREAARATD